MRQRTIHYCENRLQAYQKLRFKFKMKAIDAWNESAKFEKIERWFGDGLMSPRYIDGFRGGENHEVGSWKVFWSEKPGEYLRTVGTYSDVCKKLGWRCDHTGWYLDREFQEEVTEGIVYQMPARKGQTRFMIGRTDPNNPGSALLEDAIYHDLESAARACDSLAQVCAEEESEYQEAYREGQKAADMLNESHDEHQECRELVREINKLKVGQAAGAMPAICSTLRSKVRSLRDSYRSAFRKAKKIIDDVGSWQKEAFDCGFADSIRKGVKVPS